MPQQGQIRYFNHAFALSSVSTLYQILDAASLSFITLATRDQRAVVELSRDKELILFLTASLEIPREEDVLVEPKLQDEQIWARKLGLARVDRTAVSTSPMLDRLYSSNNVSLPYCGLLSTKGVRYFNIRYHRVHWRPKVWLLYLEWHL